MKMWLYSKQESQKISIIRTQEYVILTMKNAFSSSPRVPIGFSVPSLLKSLGSKYSVRLRENS
jgi:hypothetical protein